MATYDGKKALIVDDFPTARRHIKLNLEEIGFECTETYDVNIAFQYLIEKHIDVVLADSFMPGKNGFDLLTEIYNNPELNKIHVFLTMMYEKSGAEADRMDLEQLFKKRM